MIKLKGTFLDEITHDIPSQKLEQGRMGQRF